MKSSENPALFLIPLGLAVILGLFLMSEYNKTTWQKPRDSFAKAVTSWPQDVHAISACERACVTFSGIDLSHKDLICSDSILKPLNSDRTRSNCVRFDDHFVNDEVTGILVKDTKTKWCVNVQPYPIEIDPHTTRVVNCLGLVPETSE